MRRTRDYLQRGELEAGRPHRLAVDAFDQVPRALPSLPFDLFVHAREQFPRGNTKERLKREGGFEAGLPGRTLVSADLGFAARTDEIGDLRLGESRPFAVGSQIIW